MSHHIPLEFPAGALRRRLPNAACHTFVTRRSKSEVTTSDKHGVALLMVALRYYFNVEDQVTLVTPAAVDFENFRRERPQLPGPATGWPPARGPGSRRSLVLSCEPSNLTHPACPAGSTRCRTACLAKVCEPREASGSLAPPATRSAPDGTAARFFGQATICRYSWMWTVGRSELLPETGAESAIADSATNLTSKSASRRDQHICSALFIRRFTRKLAVPSVSTVPTREPARCRSA
jgi:hypothetical protein